MAVSQAASLLGLWLAYLPLGLHLMPAAALVPLVSPGNLHVYESLSQQHFGDCGHPPYMCIRPFQFL